MKKTIKQDYELPGTLKFSITTTLHTIQATQLFYGRKENKENGKERIIGLNDFAKRLQTITVAAYNDDPYADCYLVRIEDRIYQMEAFLSKIQRNLFQSIATDLDTGRSVKPVKIVTAFKNPHANMALNLLKVIDSIILSLEIAKHVTLIKPDEAATQIETITEKARSLFMSTLYYHNTEITRADVLANNVKAQTAHKLMRFKDALPAELLAKDNNYRAEYAPVIRATNSLIRESNQPVRRRRKTQTEE